MLGPREEGPFGAAERIARPGVLRELRLPLQQAARRFEKSKKARVRHPVAKRANTTVFQSRTVMATPMMCVREDWTDFRTLETLCRRAGVSPEFIPRLVAKELVDNAIDASGSCRSGLLEGGSFFVEDDGDGIAGDDQTVANLFSIRRPFTSSKLFRLATRGALGNGLRVVAGAVLASGGTLTVKTRGRTLTLQPQIDGTTTVIRSQPCEGLGTRVEVRLGPKLIVDPDDLFEWARYAEHLAGKGREYSHGSRKRWSSPWWYGEESFWELLQANGARPVRAIVAQLDGCSGPKAGAVAKRFLNREAASLNHKETAQLLARARKTAEPVNPKRLGQVGALDDYLGYSRPVYGNFTHPQLSGTLIARVPFVVEAWANVAAEPAVIICVNRTPITSQEVHVQRSGEDPTRCVLFGCNLGYRFQVGKARHYTFLLNIQCPALLLTTDGKEPDLKPLHAEIITALEKAARRAAKAHLAVRGRHKGQRKKQVILGALDQAIEKISGGGHYRYSLRQLFYAIRPLLIQEFGAEPKYGTFSKVIKDHEDNRGRDLPGIYRDSRGVLYHPHTGEEIPLGTLTVEKYRRPLWTFNKILYCEKEGFFPILKDVRWPDRYDCALLTSKGYATRAVCDVLNLMGEIREPITFFCIHDADGPGTMIYQTMQAAVNARPGAGNVRIINLGLDPDEALAMGLSPEAVERKKRKKGDKHAIPVADYVRPEGRAWLQTNRVELNTMTTPQFLAWLDRKITPFHTGKLVPPAAVLADRLRETLRQEVRQGITEAVLRQADVDGKVESACAALEAQVGLRLAGIGHEVHDALQTDPAQHWSVPIDRVAAELASGDVEWDGSK
jgi:hypothetical protein